MNDCSFFILLSKVYSSLFLDQFPPLFQNRIL